MMNKWGVVGRVKADNAPFVGDASLLVQATVRQPTTS